MLLSKIIGSINPKEIIFFKKDCNIPYITANSKLVKKNSIYVIDLNKNLKKEFLHEAIKNGALAILTNKKIYNCKITQILVTNLSFSVKLILSLLKPFPPVNIIGITGTNGKTSVVWIASNILKSSGFNVKSLGTLGYYENIKKKYNSSLTTPEKEELHQFLYSSKYNKYEAVLEISSHGISKKRIQNLPINIAAITNISRDHLDYHKNFKNYKNTKFKLFFDYLSNGGVAIINDKINGINFLKNKLKKNNIKFITYGKLNSNVNLSFVKNKKVLKIYSNKYHVKVDAITNYDLENFACAISCCLAIGIKINKIKNCLNKITRAHGRMQLINLLHNNSKVFVDYAHSPDALKSILINEHLFPSKPNLLFGCGGDRDKNKRLLMGKIANKYANKIL